MRVVYAERAKADIGAIHDAIAVDNPAGARRVEDRIRKACERLPEFPYAAAATDEPGIFRLPLVRYPYTIFYRIDAERGRIEIARVVHSRRVRNLGQPPWER
jgi:plasmid stabilization system protein ParE